MQATAIAHPNVALIKYWGKKDPEANIPAVGSLSLTLSGLETRTTVTFDTSATVDAVVLNGEVDEKTTRGATRCLDLLRTRAGVSAGATVESVNSFPTGAGLASSASGYAALVTAAAAALNLNLTADELAGYARIGSGSAPRSLYAGIVLLTNNDPDDVRCESVASPNDWPLAVVVAITSTRPKAIGSTEGMELSRTTSPYYQPWVDTHPADLNAALEMVKVRDFMALAELSEHSCLKMHAVAMTSREPLIYWSAATVACMQRVHELRREGVPVFFTIDAGPQLKAVCLPEALAMVREELGKIPGVIDTIECGLGKGAWVES